MYISLIRLKTLDSYEQHKAIWTLFPDTPDRKRDHLFRIEAGQRNEVTALLQSSTEPKGSVDAEVMQTKKLHLALSAGEYFKFKLTAYPAKRSATSKRIIELKNENEQIEWLHRKLESANVTVTSVSSTLVRNKNKINVLFTTFEGILQVNNVEKINRLVFMGIGRKKHAGAGLLSLARTN